MTPTRSDAERRAEGLRVALTVRTNRSGDPVWYACWRDSSKDSKMLTVGPAWLAPLDGSGNAFVRQADDRERAKHVTERWRRSWKPRTTRAKGSAEEKRRLLALDEKEALNRATELVVEHERAKDDLRRRIDERSNPRTFAAIADRWIAEKRAEVKDGALKPSTLTDYEAVVRHPSDLTAFGQQPSARLMRAFGARKPSDIDAKEIRAFLTKLRDEDGLSESTRRKYANVIGMIFAFSLEHGWTTSNPAIGARPAKRARRRKAPLVLYTVEQVEAIARECGGQDGEIVRLAAYTGLRRGELLALRWGSIDWAGQALRVEASWDHRAGAEGLPKSGVGRSVPLGGQAAEVLERISRRDTKTGARDLVFPGARAEHVDGSALSRRYRSALAAVQARYPECPDLPFHKLRHTFGSLLASGGVSIVDIQSHMGHEDIATTSIYLHFVPRSNAAAAVTEAFQRASLPQPERLLT